MRIWIVNINENVTVVRTYVNAIKFVTLALVNKYTITNTVEPDRINTHFTSHTLTNVHIYPNDTDRTKMNTIEICIDNLEYHAIIILSRIRRSQMLVYKYALIEWVHTIFNIGLMIKITRATNGFNNIFSFHSDLVSSKNENVWWSNVCGMGDDYCNDFLLCFTFIYFEQCKCHMVVWAPNRASSNNTSNVNGDPEIFVF